MSNLICQKFGLLLLVNRLWRSFVRLKFAPLILPHTGQVQKSQTTMASATSGRSPPTKTWSGAAGVTLCLPICPSPSSTGRRTRAAVSRLMPLMCSSSKSEYRSDCSRFLLYNRVLSCGALI